MNSVTTILAAGITTACAWAQAGAQSVTFTTSTPTNTTPGWVDFTLRGMKTTVPVPPGTTAAGKRTLIKDALVQKGYAVVEGPNANSATILGLKRSDIFVLSTGNTGEGSDVVLSADAGGGLVTFTGHFDSLDSAQLPAVFTAGIVTDVGEFTAEVSASELNFQTDGPIICQALFQRLAPRAPQYGAQINYSGDRLEVYFDPAYTATTGGVSFGTTSTTPGCAGTVEMDRVAVPVRLTCSNSTNASPQIEAVSMSPASMTPVTIAPFSSAPAVCDAVRNGLLAQGRHVFAGSTPSSMIIRQRGPKDVSVQLGRTGQMMSILDAPTATQGYVRYSNFLDPMSSMNQPAIFTAGIVTDVGQVTVQVSAAELNFQTQGPIICQALFQRLAPQAPQFGAQIGYVGDRLEVYFDPTYTVSTGGVIFGTTSRGEGCSAGLHFPPLRWTAVPE